MIKRRETLREPFTDYLDGLYDDLDKSLCFVLVSKSLTHSNSHLVDAELAAQNASPGFLKQRRIRDARGARSVRRSTVQVRVFNPNFPAINLESTHLSLASLMDEDSAFDEFIFASPPEADESAPLSGSPLAGMMD